MGRAHGELRRAVVMNRGEAEWLEHPGHRPPSRLHPHQAGGDPGPEHVLVEPATRTVRGIPTEVLLSREDGMPDDCALTFDNLVTVPKRLLTGRITALAAGRRQELCAALEAAAEC